MATASSAFALPAHGGLAAPRRERGPQWRRARAHAPAAAAAAVPPPPPPPPPPPQQPAPASRLPLQRSGAVSRRTLLAGGAALGAALPASSALALYRPPPGFRLWRDLLDGYSFLYPADWLSVTTAGADVFFRDPLTVDETLFVDVTSPSSTRFENVAQYGTLEEAGEKLLAQYLIEFASTRLGVKREGTVLSTSYRTADDGQAYLDAEFNFKSFAVKQQYGIDDQGRGPQALEWDRRLITTLGVANGRLYSLRLQASEARVPAVRERFRQIQESFRAYDLNAV